MFSGCTNLRDFADFKFADSVINEVDPSYDALRSFHSTFAGLTKPVVQTAASIIGATNTPSVAFSTFYNALGDAVWSDYDTIPDNWKANV
jgi:hypothetical protein